MMQPCTTRGVVAVVVGPDGEPMAVTATTTCRELERGPDRRHVVDHERGVADDHHHRDDGNHPNRPEGPTATPTR